MKTVLPGLWISSFFSCTGESRTGMFIGGFTMYIVWATTEVLSSINVHVCDQMAGSMEFYHVIL